MLGTSGVVLLLESSLAVIFFSVMLALWQRVDYADAALWILVWATRVFASLNGIIHLSEEPGRLGAYIGLQALSGITLILILARGELKVFKERLIRHLVIRLADATPANGRGKRCSAA